MAYSAYQYSGGILYPEHASQIVIDSSADLADIDLDVVAPGTRVVDCSSGSMYILSPSKQWKLVQNDVAAAANSVVKESASGDIAVISDGADDVAVKSLVAEITPVQSGSGDPSPTNICPISGRTGLTVTRAGKNLFSPDNLIFGYWIRNEWHPGGETWCGVIIPVVAGMQVHVSGNHCIGGVNLAWLTSRTDPSAGLTGQTEPATSAVNNTTFTAPTGALGLWFPQYISQTQPIDMSELMIEYGASASAYEPYTAQTYPISWQTQAGTVYGGTLDVVSGVLTVDRKYEEFDGSTDEDIVLYRSNVRNSFLIALAETCAAMVANKSLTSSIPYSSSSERDGGGITCRITSYASKNFYVFMPPETASTVEEMRAYLANQPLQLVYYIATPQTYQLTPTEVRTLLGGNNIYTDAGDVSVEYIADTKLYIDNKVAELQALILEN